MTDIPTTEPDEFIAGDTVKWQISDTDYPASDDWVLSYALVKDGVNHAIEATADGDDHLVTIAAADSADYTPGRYYWQAYFTKDAERYSAGTGYLTVIKDFATAATGHDGRDHIDRVLDALEATIEKRATKDQSGVMIGGEQIGKMPIHRLLEFYDKYKSMQASATTAARIAAGLGHENNIFIRFTDE